MDGTPVELDPAVTALAELAREYGHHAGRHYFAGVVADHLGHAITIYRVPDADFDGEVVTLLDGDVEVRLVDAPHTRDELVVARERVWALAEELPITSISLPPDGTRLTVVCDAPVDDVQVELDRVAPGMATATSGRVVPL